MTTSCFLSFRVKPPCSVFLLVLMSDPHCLLHAILKKVPALWDMEALDLLNNHQIASQVDGAHTLLVSDCFLPGFPDFHSDVFLRRPIGVFSLVCILTSLNVSLPQPLEPFMSSLTNW